jgi:hypothetical protein
MCRPRTNIRVTSRHLEPNSLNSSTFDWTSAPMRAICHSFIGDKRLGTRTYNRYRVYKLCLHNIDHIIRPNTRPGFRHSTDGQEPRRRVSSGAKFGAPDQSPRGRIACLLHPLGPPRWQPVQRGGPLRCPASALMPDPNQSPQRQRLVDLSLLCVLHMPIRATRVQNSPSAREKTLPQ